MYPSPFIRQMLLILSYCTMPCPYLLVLTHPNLLRDLIDESKVMTDKYHTSFIMIYRFCERVNTLNIQMICRLIKKKKIWIPHTHQCENYSRLLPFRQLPNHC